MKKISILIIIACTFNCVYAQSTRTIITGSVPDLINTEVKAQYGIVQSLDIENPVELHIFKLDRGKFSFILNLTKPTDLVLQIEDRTMFVFPLGKILIEPGDSIHIAIPNFKKTAFLDIIFSGKGSRKLELLQDIWRPVMTLPQKFLKTKTITDFKETFLSDIKKFKMLDSAFQVNHSLFDSKIFNILRTQNLSLTYGSTMHMMASRTDNDTIATLYKENILPRALKDEFTKPDNFNYLTYFHNELIYLALLDYGIKHKLRVDLLSVRDFPLLYLIISEYFEDLPAIRDHLLAERLIVQMKSKGLTTSTEKFVKLFLSDLPSGIFHDQVLRRYQLTKQNNSKGTPFFNFALEDSSGKIVKLSDFRGKLILIDFYFNGCGPCRLLAPKIAELEEKYKNNDIVFLSVSVDASRKLWADGRGKFSSPTSIQLYTNGEGKKHPLVIHAGIVGYPSLFLIDKEGRIAATNIFPTQEKISEKIDETLKQFTE